MMSNYDETEQQHKALVVNTTGQHSQRHDKLHNENRLLYNKLDTPCKAV